MGRRAGGIKGDARRMQSGQPHQPSAATPAPPRPASACPPPRRPHKVLAPPPPHPASTRPRHGRTSSSVSPEHQRASPPAVVGALPPRPRTYNYPMLARMHRARPRATQGYHRAVRDTPPVLMRDTTYDYPPPRHVLRPLPRHHVRMHLVPRRMRPSCDTLDSPLTPQWRNGAVPNWIWPVDPPLAFACRAPKPSHWPPPPLSIPRKPRLGPAPAPWPEEPHSPRLRQASTQSRNSPADPRLRGPRTRSNGGASCGLGRPGHDGIGQDLGSSCETIRPPAMCLPFALSRM
ncbi:hypothetical protein CERSUDRAFT_90042 [Gelatoporia subvermispora B]|uniref:Uncharacterized protein n=1 Tax=Ceriporiopsis subvermispora (strain B) TaxID=914234 RepID=M2RAP0_CERS8|nr:hypothetical protein CERSUDRAFT_90042 [Gelatoporia subvermispora B]